MKNTDRITPDRDAVALFDAAINDLIVSATNDEALRRLWYLKTRTKRLLIGQVPATVETIARAAHAELQWMISHAA